MTTKNIKLIAAILLATGVGLFAFIQPAEAGRRKSRPYSETSIDATAVITQFGLVDTTRQGQAIGDTDSAENIGFFDGAIENLTLGNGQLTELGGQYDALGNLLFQVPFNPQEYLLSVGNLKAELIANDPDFPAQDATIRYSILQPSADQVITIPKLGSSSQPLPLEFVLFPTSEIDQQLAVNSLSYILDNNLLGKSQTGSRLILANSPIQEEEIPESNTTVPEASTSVASLFLGSLAVGSLLKRKVKGS